MNLIWFKTNKLLDDTNNGKILANITIRLINAVEEYLASIGRSVIQSFSRQHELEANRLGMTIINWAGYDISGIPNFWRKMSQTSSYEFDFFLTYLYFKLIVVFVQLWKSNKWRWLYLH